MCRDLRRRASRSHDGTRRIITNRLFDAMSEVKSRQAGIVGGDCHGRRNPAGHPGGKAPCTTISTPTRPPAAARRSKSRSRTSRSRPAARSLSVRASTNAVVPFHSQGDWRPMLALAEALDAGEIVEVVVADWQIIAWRRP